VAGRRLISPARLRSETEATASAADGETPLRLHCAILGRDSAALQLRRRHQRFRRVLAVYAAGGDFDRFCVIFY
jgi:hypothetical protein